MVNSESSEGRAGGGRQNHAGQNHKPRIKLMARIRTGGTKGFEQEETEETEERIPLRQENCEF
jgi:hypothetical protein